LHKRIVGLKIISNAEMSSPLYLSPVLKYFEDNMVKFGGDVTATENILCLVGIVPSLKELKKGIKYCSPKECIVYKTVLDVLGLYLRDTDKPHFKVSQKHALMVPYRFTKDNTCL
jgi:hypothetical protein